MCIPVLYKCVVDIVHMSSVDVILTPDSEGRRGSGRKQGGTFPPPGPAVIRFVILHINKYPTRQLDVSQSSLLGGNFQLRKQTLDQIDTVLLQEF